MNISRSLSLLTIVTLLLGALSQPAAAQRRASKPEAKDFPTTAKQAQEAFAAQDYATALALLAEATELARKEQRKQIQAAMPDIAGLQKTPPAEGAEDGDAAAAMFGGLATAIPVEQEYTGDEDKRLVLKVTAASPAVAMYRVVLDNPTLLAAQKGQELVEYDGYKALLDTQSEGYTKLTVFVGEQGMIEAEGQNLGAEQLLAAMSQQNVEALAKPITPKKKAG